MVWEFILLIELAKLVIKDVTVAPEDAQKLESIILATSPDLSASPDVYLKRTCESGYKVKVGQKGVAGAEFGEKKTTDGSSVDLIDYTNGLKKLLLETAQIGKSYQIIVDELDDSYSDSKMYFDLIIALFKAAVSINYSANQERKKCTVFVALRDDIFDSIDYGDKNKWSDMAIRISWLLKPGEKPLSSDLFNMINVRIGASLVNTPKIGVNYWRGVFSSENVKADLRTR